MTTLRWAAELAPPEGTVLIRSNSYAYDVHWLHAWQSRWLNILELLGPHSKLSVSLSGPRLTDIDGILWPCLRVLYSASEADMIRHGYNPFLQQIPHSLLSIEVEASVVKAF